MADADILDELDALLDSSDDEHPASSRSPAVAPTPAPETPPRIPTPPQQASLPVPAADTPFQIASPPSMEVRAPAAQPVHPPTQPSPTGIAVVTSTEPTPLPQASQELPAVLSSSAADSLDEFTAASIAALHVHPDFHAADGQAPAVPAAAATALPSAPPDSIRALVPAWEAAISPSHALRTAAVTEGVVASYQLLAALHVHMSTEQSAGLQLLPVIAAITAWNSPEQAAGVELAALAHASAAWLQVLLGPRDTPAIAGIWLRLIACRELPHEQQPVPQVFACQACAALALAAVPTTVRQHTPVPALVPGLAGHVETHWDSSPSEPQAALAWAARWWDQAMQLLQAVPVPVRASAALSAALHATHVDSIKSPQRVAATMGVPCPAAAAASWAAVHPSKVALDAFDIAQQAPPAVAVGPYGAAVRELRTSLQALEPSFVSAVPAAWLLWSGDARAAAKKWHVWDVRPAPHLATGMLAPSSRSASWLQITPVASDSEIGTAGGAGSVVSDAASESSWVAPTAVSLGAAAAAAAEAGAAVAIMGIGPKWLARFYTPAALPSAAQRDDARVQEALTAALSAGCHAAVIDGGFSAAWGAARLTGRAAPFSASSVRLEGMLLKHAPVSRHDTACGMPVAGTSSALGGLLESSESKDEQAGDAVLSNVATSLQSASAAAGTFMTSVMARTRARSASGASQQTAGSAARTPTLGATTAAPALAEATAGLKRLWSSARSNASSMTSKLRERVAQASNAPPDSAEASGAPTPAPTVTLPYSLAVHAVDTLGTLTPAQVDVATHAVAVGSATAADQAIADEAGTLPWQAAPAELTRVQWHKSEPCVLTICAGGAKSIKLRCGQVEEARALQSALVIAVRSAI